MPGPEAVPMTEDPEPGRPALFHSSAFWFWLITIPLAYYWCVSTFIGLDDAYIYFRIAENLVWTGLPVFNAGDGRFIATSPLWTLMLAAGKWAVPSLNLVLFAKGLSVLLLGLAAWFAHRLFAPRLPAGAALLAMPFLLSHALAGMAGGEVALLVAATMGTLWAAAERRPVTAGILLGIGVLARGEFILIVPLLIAGEWWAARGGGEPRGRTAGRLGIMLGVGAFIVALSGIWLAWTFGDPLPHTLAVKRMQGMSGKWGLYPHEIWSSVRRTLPGWRLALLPLAALGAWRFPGASAAMAGYTLLHALAYTALRVPAYGWYYYDLVLFVPLLVFLGAATAVGWLTERAMRPAWIRGRDRRWTAIVRGTAAAALVMIPMLWIFPLHGSLFHPRYAPRLWSDEAPGERFRAYRGTARRLLPELGPGDVVLANEIGILAYYLNGVEIRDNNGLASPGITAQTMNCWECAVDRYRPRFIVFPARLDAEEKVFAVAGNTHRYRRRFVADPAAVRFAASVYEREDETPP